MSQVPSEAVEAAISELPRARRSEATAAVKAAAPHIRKQERERIEAEHCENCDGTGIYEEGDEWAPCEECELGRGFLEYLRSHAGEVRKQERERLATELRKRAALTPIPSSPLEEGKADGLEQAANLLDTLEADDE